MLQPLQLLTVVAYVTMVSAAALNARQLQWPPLPYNLTEVVLKVGYAVSPPCAVNETLCPQLTGVVIPRCIRLRGDPGCWCGSHDQLHYCAICMASPDNNLTTPDQTQAAGAGHNEFHIACNAYEELINGTAKTTTSSLFSTSSPTPTPSVVTATAGDNKMPVGPIVGGVVGGVVGLALVVGILWLISIILKRNDPRSEVRPSSVSIMSSERKSPANMYAAPYPQLNSYPAPDHISPPVSHYFPNPDAINPAPTQPATDPAQPAQK